MVKPPMIAPIENHFCDCRHTGDASRAAEFLLQADPESDTPALAPAISHNTTLPLQVKDRLPRLTMRAASPITPSDPDVTSGLNVGRGDTMPMRYGRC